MACEFFDVSAVNLISFVYSLVLIVSDIKLIFCAHHEFLCLVLTCTERLVCCCLLLSLLVSFDVANYLKNACSGCICMFQGKITCANVLSDVYAMGVVSCDNMLMLLGVSQKLNEKERDTIIPLIMRGFTVGFLLKNIYRSIYIYCVICLSTV
jgi:hypothetical protein